MQNNLYYFPLCLNVPLSEVNVLCNIIAIIEKNMVPSIYCIFGKYLLTDYMVTGSFATSLFYQNVARGHLIIRFNLVPGTKEVTYLRF